MSITQKIAHFLGLATLKDIEGIRPRSLRAAKPNPVQIAAMYPVYFTTADGSGTPYIVSHQLQAFALRHGVALRFVLEQEPGKYGYIPANPSVEIVTPIKVLTGPGQLEDIDVPEIGGYAVTLADDIGSEQYEATTGVPDGGFLEGTEIGSTPVVVGSQGVHGAAQIDIWTSTGFVTRMEAGAPVVLE